MRIRQVFNYLCIGCVLIAILSGCKSISQKDVTEQELWDKVVGREFSNYDSWAGSGFAFHEDDEGNWKCTFMIYGSGVPVAYHYTSEATIEDGLMMVELPNDMNQSTSEGNIEVTAVSISINDGFIMIGDTKFTESVGMNSYEGILNIE